MKESCVEREISKQQEPMSTVGRPVNAFVPQEKGGGGVLRISSDGDGGMQENIKVKKSVDTGLPTNPHKNPGPAITPRKSHAEFPSTTTNLQIVFELLHCTKHHGRHVGGQEQKHFSPLWELTLPPGKP